MFVEKRIDKAGKRILMNVTDVYLHVVIVDRCGAMQPDLNKASADVLMRKLLFHHISFIFYRKVGMAQHILKKVGGQICILLW
jgi:hypothetical protein